MKYDENSDDLEKRGSIAEYIGFSAPEVPRYLLTNNFLTRYFNYNEDTGKEYTYEDFTQALVCEETDENAKEMIEKSFNAFFERFSGKTLYERDRTNTRILYFPITGNMLRAGSFPLRHLIYKMQLADKKYDDYNFQKKLKHYLYDNLTGANNLLSFLCKQLPDTDKMKEAARIEKLTDSYVKNDFFRQLGKQLNRDMDSLLCSELFLKLDFYKRYDYLSILLYSYVIQFIIWRNESDPFILCKGAADDSDLNNGEFHRACTQNYATIRQVFSRLQNEYYLERMQNEVNDIIVSYKDEQIFINDKDTFIQYTADHLDSRYKDNVQTRERICQCFHVNERKPEKKFTKDQFIIAYMNFSNGKKGSNIVKISSVLPTSGREIGFVFPTNTTKHKYFALSHELLEFYVRLYLARKRIGYAYLDDFLRDLEENYHIYIVKSNEMNRQLNRHKLKVSSRELQMNESSLISNLKKINCLIKLSDSGYVVTVSENRGEFRLL